MPGGDIGGDSGLLLWAWVQCVTSNVRAQWLPIVCWINNSMSTVHDTDVKGMDNWIQNRSGDRPTHSYQLFFPYIVLTIITDAVRGCCQQQKRKKNPVSIANVSVCPILKLTHVIVFMSDFRLLKFNRYGCVAYIRDGVAQLVELSDSRSKYTKDRRFESRLRQEQKTNLWEFFRVKIVKLTHSRCAQPPCVHARIRIITYAR